MGQDGLCWTRRVGTQRRLGLEKISRGRLGEFWLEESKSLFGLAGSGDVGLPGSQVPDDCEDDITGKYRFIRVVFTEL